MQQICAIGGKIIYFSLNVGENMLRLVLESVTCILGKGFSGRAGQEVKITALLYFSNVSQEKMYGVFEYCNANCLTVANRKPGKL